MSEEKKYTPVADGYWKCKIVNVATKQVYMNGNAMETKHMILRVSVAPVSEDRTNKAAPEDAQAYTFDLPLIYDNHENWKFWDNVKKAFVERLPTNNDTIAALTKARELIPEWDEFIEATPASEGQKVLFDWFWGEEFKALTLTCKLKNRSYVVNGVEKCAYDALLVAPQKAMSAETWTAAHEKMAKAFLKRTGKKVETKAVKEAPSAPPPPKSAPKAVASYETTWSAYCEKGLPADAWWDFASSACGKDAGVYTSWTSSDWQKVMDKISAEEF